MMTMFAVQKERTNLAVVNAASSNTPVPAPQNPSFLRENRQRKMQLRAELREPQTADPLRASSTAANGSAAAPSPGTAVGIF